MLDHTGGAGSLATVIRVTWLPRDLHSETMWTVWPTAPFRLPLQTQSVSFKSKAAVNLHTDFPVIRHPAATASCSKYYKAHYSGSQHFLSVPPSGRCGLYAVRYGVVCSTVDVLVRLQGQLLIAGQAEDCQRYPAQRSP